MSSPFEIKTYGQLNLALGAVNVALFTLTALAADYCVFTPAHSAALGKLTKVIADEKILSLVSGSAVVVGWGWITTIVLRLHDRLHEPHIRKWRAGYDADFVLRSLLSDCGVAISPDLYERAYADRRVRNKLMQRLFYSFVGDETKIAEGRRTFIYTALLKYWTCALVDLYATVVIIGASVYHISTHTPPKPWLVVIAMALMTAARVFANWTLDEAHAISIDQIHEIKQQHINELQKRAIEVETELGA